MKDLTQGSIPKHILVMAIPIAIGMLVQTLYYLVDLYFVGRLGEVALAGVSAAGNASFLIIALTQILGVGTVALISHAVGRKDQEDANLVFNQSLFLSVLLGVITLTVGYFFSESYLQTISSDSATVEAGKSYLFWYLPGMAGQFALVAMGSALRGTGIVMPTMVVQFITVLINIILAPILIAGWLTGHPMGVAGAGLASSIAVGIGVIMLWLYFNRVEKYVSYDSKLIKPQFKTWKRMLGVGLPAGGEFILMFFYMAIIYWTIRDFGASAQAGFGLGSRIMQSMFLPAMAVAFAAPAVAGQNYGAQLSGRVKQTFYWSSGLSVLIMLCLTIVCFLKPFWLVKSFSSDLETLHVSSTFLQMICLNFIASGVIFTCSGMFQALGNTWPALWSTGSRLITFAIPAIWLSKQTDFEIEQLWYASVVTVYLQLLISVLLLRHQFKKRLNF